MAETAWQGRVLDGRYAVESILGSGGMGVVLRARHRFTGALVAVKMLHADLNRDPQLEARFLAEARASNAIGHPAIVQVLDAGRTPEGELYLVMELLAGQPLRAAVSRGLGQPAIRRIGLELLDALAAAHARWFVHRDLKPENVFLADPGASVKLLDFGIAKTLAADGTNPATEAGVVLGTVAYMAPEQLRDAHAVDARADLWALGVMIYEMLAGRLPYRGTTVEEIFVRLAREEPDPIRAWIPTIAPEIERFLARALAREPSARFSSAAEMAAALVQLPLVQAPPMAPRPATDRSPDATVATGFGQTGSAAPSAHGLPIAGPASTPLPIATPAPLFSAQHPIVGPSAPYATPFAPPPPSNRARTLGIAFALGAVGVIVAAIVVLASRHRAEPPKDGRTDLVVTAGSPPPAPRPSIDTTPPAPPDAAVVASPPAPPHTAPRHATPGAKPRTPASSRTTPPPPSGPQPQQPYPDEVQAVDPCIASCALGANRCALSSNAQCMTACRQNQTLNHCAAAANNDCNALARCLFSSLCNAPVANGRASCSTAASCQASCTAGDGGCACRCTAQVATIHAAALFRLDSCAATCATTQGCVAANCASWGNRCKAE